MPTLKDVAEKSGVTVTTVSRVLNNRGYISDATRKKVYDAMKELNYHPNEMARSLTKKRTNMIGVIVPSISHPFFSKVVSCLEYYAAQKGYKIMLCNSHHEREKEIGYFDMLRSNKVAGIVMCSRTERVTDDLDITLPVVLFERALSGDFSTISCDNYEGGHIAVMHLIEKGCHNLLYIGGPEKIPLPANLRGQAFQDVCEQYHVRHMMITTEEEQFHIMDYTGLIEEVLKAHPEIDGVFASSDVIASDVIYVCNKLGIRIPEQLKVVGFDDDIIASRTTPRITTIRQPVRQMCECAISTILNKLDGQIVPTKTMLPVFLIKRETT